MLFLKRIFYFIILLFPCLLNAQELQKDSVESQILAFLLSTDDAGVFQTIDALFFYDYLKDSAMRSLPVLSKDSVAFYGFMTLKLPRYGHFLISYDGKDYIINMRRSLNTLLEELDFHFDKSNLFTEDIRTKILNVIKRAHKNNWEMNHDYAGWSEEDLYNPEEW